MGSISQAQGMFNAGDNAGAAKVCQELLRRDPGNVDLMYLLALAAQRLGQSDVSIRTLRAALTHRKDLPAIHFVLGNALRATGQLRPAIESYREALRLKPDYADAMINLGIALATIGQPAEAKQIWERALEMNPRDPDALSNLGNLARHDGRIGEAIRLAERALEVNPKRHTTLSNLGVAYGRQGRLDDAIAMYRRALEANPRSPRIYSNLLLDLTYHDRIAPADLFAEHRRWNKLFASAWEINSSRPYLFPDDRDVSRRLRVGYVSADLRDHAVAYFIEPVLAHHDPQQVEVFCYFAGPREDDVTRRLKSHGGNWRSLWGVRDDAAAYMVRSDRIDILVDLAVHTAGHRLLLFARKPAPVQVTWLGYAGTTGMDAMDYRLTDSIVDPPGLSEAFHSEELVRLPRTQWCYQPPVDASAVSPPPCDATGHITFGSATNLAKVTATTLDLWCDVVKSVAGSRFALLARGLADQSTRDFIAGAFAKRGIGPDRLDLIEGGDLSHYLNFFSRLDIALDTHPFAGGTTTCHTLWMGVPVVTMTGQTSVSRVAASVLSNIGLADLIADSPTQFVAIAQSIAGDSGRLRELRHGLRERMRGSALCDAEPFARQLENACRTMWERWCAGMAP